MHADERPALAAARTLERVDAMRPGAPSLADLFLAFLGVALMGFGGVMPWARRMLVEKRKWMDDREFAEALALAQFLPGGNIMNLAVAVGQRYRGAPGSLAAAAGLLLGPVVLVTTVAALFLRYGQNAPMKAALAGVAAGAAGLMLSMAAKLARPLVDGGALAPLAIAVAAFAAIAIIQLPLLPVVLVLAPLSVADAWRRLP
jgi:chromate transporter